MGALTLAAYEDSIALARIAAAAADRMKGEQILAYDVSETLGICDVMLIVSASNERQVLAIAEEIEKDVYLNCDKRQPKSREGVSEGQWILLDYGDVIVHVMHDDSRDFYRLERLWRDCPQVDLLIAQSAPSQDEE